MARAQRRLEARITHKDKKLLEEAATAKGLTLTAFVTSSAREAAVRTLQERHIIELGRQDQEIFVRALLNPPAPNERLRAAAERHGFELLTA
jgi:uncharacterized protein (DUF1778 family)